MLAALTLAAATAGLRAPKVNASCFGAPLRLVTDNAPVGNSGPTSVVDIWAFTRSDFQPVAWLYENGLGDYYIQFNHQANLESYLGIPMSSEILQKRTPRTGTYYPIVRLALKAFIDVENSLLARGLVRRACFNRAYKLR